MTMFFVERHFRIRDTDSTLITSAPLRTTHYPLPTDFQLSQLFLQLFQRSRGARETEKLKNSVQWLVGSKT